MKEAFSMTESFTLCPNNEKFYLHVHEHYEILWFLEGDTKYIVEGNVYPLKPGDVIVIRKHQMHRAYHNSSKRYRRFIFSLHPEFFKMCDCPEYEAEFLCSTNNKIDSEIVQTSGLHDAFLRAQKYSDDFTDLTSPIVRSIMIEILYLINKVTSYSAGKAINKDDEPEQYEGKVIEQMGRFVEVAKPYDIMICHENEKGIYGDIASRCLKIHKAYPELGGIFDPANFVQCGQDTLEAWDMLNPYIKYLHIKDATPDGKVVPAGHGVGNVLTILKKYYEAGGRDLTLEPHLKVFDGMKALEKDFDAKMIGEQNVYPSHRAAFDAAVAALNQLIEEV